MFLRIGTVAGPGFRAKAVLISEAWTPCPRRMDFLTKLCTLLVWFETWNHTGGAWAPTLGSEWLLLFRVCSCISVSIWKLILLLWIIAGQEKPVPRLFPISSLQHFTVMVGISVVCGREWLKNPYWFLSTWTSSCLQAYLDQGPSSSLLGPPLYGTAAVAGFIRSRLGWGTWSPVSVHFGVFLLCVWTMVPSLRPSHRQQLQRRHPPSM